MLLNTIVLVVNALDSRLTSVVLLVMVAILVLLLVLRQRQMKRLNPLVNLEQVLDNLKKNTITSRVEGKIQKVASQLSDIMINNLQSERLLFFRKQRRFMEMNYVYGLKNVHRAKYRIKLSNALLSALTDGNFIRHHRELKSLLPGDLIELLERERFNIVFPIFWMDNLFGVYFISTKLPANHPLISTFLLFLNQNLSVAYHIKRLESSRQILESKVENDRRVIERLEGKKSTSEPKVAEEDPGHLIEMFNYRNVDELVAGLFDKVKAGLQAEKMVFLSRQGQEEKSSLKYSLGMQKKDFLLDGDDFQQIFGRLQKRQIYPVSHLREINVGRQLQEQLERERIRNMSTFSLSDGDQGILFWTGKKESDKAETKILARFEKIAQRALVNAREFERVEEMSYTDGLTGLYNHRYFVKRLNEEIQRAVRYQRRLGLLLFDIDDFKLYNDNFGHQWGDELLRRMGTTLSRTLRSIDIVSRYGGDEFGIIMPEADKSTCVIFMDRLRHSIAGTDFRDKANGFEGRITISIGSAIFPDDADAAERLIYCADMALFRSKALGRNRSTIYDAALFEQSDSNI